MVIKIFAALKSRFHAPFCRLSPNSFYLCGPRVSPQDQKGRRNHEAHTTAQDDSPPTLGQQRSRGRVLLLSRL